MAKTTPVIHPNSPAALIIAVLGVSLIVFRDVFNHIISGSKKSPDAKRRP